MVRRTKTQAGETRDSLVAAAATLFARKGYAATTLSEISASASTTKGAIFHHFASKQALFEVVWAREQTQMDDAARNAAVAARSKTDPYAAFLAGCRVYMDHVSAPGYRQIVMVDGPVVLGAEDWHAEDSRLGLATIEAGVAYLARVGLAPSGAIKPLSVLLFGALNEAGFALGRGEPGVSADSLLANFERLLRSLH